MSYDRDLMKVYTPKDQYIESLDEDLSEEEIRQKYFTTEYYGVIEGKWRPLVNFDPFTSDRVMYDDGFSYIWQERGSDFMYLRSDIFAERYPEELI